MEILVSGVFLWYARETKSIRVYVRAFVVMMQIVHQQEVNGLKVADKIRVYQIATKEPDPVKAITKTSDRPNLYEAVDLANVWLKRAEKDAAAK